MLSIKLVSAAWCGPCKAYKPVLQQFCNENSIGLQEIDADTNPEFVHTHSISSVPTTMIFKGDQLLFKTKGAIPKPQLQSLLAEYK